MADQSVQELEFHRDTMGKDADSPLHLIREKEIEISARLLAAKREADEIVAEARRRAASMLEEAEENATALAAERDRAIVAETEKAVAEIEASSVSEVSELECTIASRRGRAVSFIVDSVLKV